MVKKDNRPLIPVIVDDGPLIPVPTPKKTKKEKSKKNDNKKEKSKKRVTISIPPPPPMPPEIVKPKEKQQETKKPVIIDDDDDSDTIIMPDGTKKKVKYNYEPVYTFMEDKNYNPYKDYIDILDGKTPQDQRRPDVLRSALQWLVNSQYPNKTHFENYIKKQWYPGKKIGGNPINWDNIEQKYKDKIKKSHDSNPEYQRYIEDMKKIDKDMENYADGYEIYKRPESEIDEIYEKHKYDTNKDWLFAPETFYYKDIPRYTNGKPIGIKIDPEDVKENRNVLDLLNYGTVWAQYEPNKLFVRNYSTRYEKDRTINGGNCAMVTFWQICRASRIKFDTFYDNFLVHFLENSSHQPIAADKYDTTRIKEMFHVIRPLWDGIVDGELKSWRTIGHHIAYSDYLNRKVIDEEDGSYVYDEDGNKVIEKDIKDYDWEGDKEETYNPGQFFEIYDNGNIYSFINVFLRIMFSSITHINNTIKPENYKSKDIKDAVYKYIDFMCKYTRSIPFIVYCTTEYKDKTINDVQKGFRLNHVYPCIYDTKNNTLYNFDNNNRAPKPIDELALYTAYIYTSGHRETLPVPFIDTIKINPGNYYISLLPSQQNCQLDDEYLSLV